MLQQPTGNVATTLGVCWGVNLPGYVTLSLEILHYLFVKYLLCTCCLVCTCFNLPGNPAPEVLWLHNGKEIQESEDFHFDRNGNQCSLFIQEVFPEDNGKYTCEAWNQYG